MPASGGGPKPPSGGGGATPEIVTEARIRTPSGVGTWRLKNTSGPPVPLSGVQVVDAFRLRPERRPVWWSVGRLSARVIGKGQTAGPASDRVASGITPKS